MRRPTVDATKKRMKKLEKAEVLHTQTEKALRESERKYRTLTENITVGIFRSTPGAKGVFLEANPALVRMLGYKNKKSLFSKAIAQIYQNPKDRRKFSEKMVREGSVRNEEFYLRKKDGTPIVVSETAIAVKDAKGKVVYFDGIVEDITERKKVEENLRIQKAYFERLFNSAPEAIVLHDNNDRVVNVNEEFTKLFGYTREEAIGRPINALVVPRQKRSEGSTLSRKVIHGERVEIDSKRRRKDGTLVDVWILGAPIIDGGKQMGVYAIYRDITERKKGEEELLLQKTYLEKLFNSAPEAIVLHDNNDRIVNVNDEFTRLFGYTREEAIGKPINDLVVPTAYTDEGSALSHKVIHGERIEIDSKRRRRDGTLVDVWIMGAPIIDGGKQMGIYAIYRDITERKRSEEARIRSEEEARTARNIQINFLPKSNPVVQGYEIEGRSVPALNVGGDYYDFIRLDEHRLAIGLGDVSGHGLAASLVMANVQATIRSQAFFDPDPKRCLERANKLLFESTDARTFISLFYGVLDTRNNTMLYANAGQDLPILFSTNRTSLLLESRGMALGLRKEMEYEEKEVAFHTGDRLLLYTDGIVEAMNSRREEFGETRLRKIVESASVVSAHDLLDKILRAVNLHAGVPEQNDDMTLVIVRRN
jgi:sigma-B regulation protein RsbU (phosphoserine phosphatase)